MLKGPVISLYIQLTRRVGCWISLLPLTLGRGWMPGSELGYNIYTVVLQNKRVEKIPHLKASETSEEELLSSLMNPESLIRTTRLRETGGYLTSWGWASDANFKLSWTSPCPANTTWAWNTWLGLMGGSNKTIMIQPSDKQGNSNLRLT